MERALYEVKKVIVGQDHLLERMLVALLARGHILVEGVPGLAKTLAIKTLAQAVGGEFKRIQFTPDLVPADLVGLALQLQQALGGQHHPRRRERTGHALDDEDLVGTRIYNQKTGDFSTSFGPMFTNLLLADEINRAPAKVQSALLEVMQERQVTIGRETYPVPDPFLVLATQNPIETEGTYPLPEAQVDRFMMKVLIGYPSDQEEFLIVERMTGALSSPGMVLTTQRLLELQREADAVYADPLLMEYAVQLVAATRRPAEFGLDEVAHYILYGASPRASINLILTARALAFLRGRSYVLAQDVRELVLDVVRHRLILSYEALSDNVTADMILARVMDRIRVPALPLKQHAANIL